MTAVDVAAIHGRKDLRRFVNLPWEIYRGDPRWVPQLKRDQIQLLSPGKHPFWRSAERELFLARRGRRVTGRIAAIVDHAYNRFHDEKIGIWGFFESTEDPETVFSLFAAAEAWLAERGMQFLRGPLNPSTNYEVGLQIEGFDNPATLMLPYNPPFYPRLVRLCGYRKEQDLFSFIIRKGFSFPAWAEALAERVAAHGEFTVRPADPRNLKPELRRINRLYNECLSENWGFVPMSDAELEVIAKRLVPLLDPALTFFLCHQGQEVGFCLMLPDLNPLLRRLNGKLGLTAPYKVWRSRAEIRGLRGLMFGVQEPFRQMGLPLVAFHHLLRTLRSSNRYDYLELGWNLEGNAAMNTLYEEGGLQTNKRYRVYRKELASAH